MAITYNAGTNIITVTGYTEAVPCNFTDIYNADVAGGWGKVTRQCTNQFCYSCYLHIGDGSTTTWFADEMAFIIFVDAIVPAHWHRLIDVKANATLRFGKIETLSEKSTTAGCMVRNLEQTYGTHFIEGAGTIDLYSSTFLARSPVRHSHIRTVHRLWNCVFLERADLMSSDTDVFNFQQHSFTSTGMRVLAGTASYDIIRLVASNAGGTYGLYFEFGHGTVKNANVIGSLTYDILMYQCPAGSSYVVDSVLSQNNWVFRWVTSPTATLYRQYSFDLKVIDKDNIAINGATVKIWDKDSNLIVDTTTNASGVIATQTITRGYYNQANGNTLQEASPHLIKITKAGYTAYEADFTLEDKTDWTIALQTSILRNPSMGGGMV